MWPGLFRSARDRRGRGKGAGGVTHPDAAAGQEVFVSSAEVSAADGSRAPNVSRETTPTAGPPGSWASDVADTPIGAAAERAMHVAHSIHPQLPRPAHRRVLTIANQKGGVGKTTTAVNLAAALALHGMKTLVIDLDPQGNASTALAIEHRSGTPSVYEVLIGEISISDAAAVSEQSPNLYCVPATIDL